MSAEVSNASSYRGLSCESFVRSHIRYWRSLGWLPYQNHKKVAGGKFVEGEPFDFTILADSRCICLECKEVSKGRRFKVTASQHRNICQANNLERVKQLGHAGFFVVFFKECDIIGVYTPKMVLCGVTPEDSLGSLSDVVLKEVLGANN